MKEVCCSLPLFAAMCLLLSACATTGETASAPKGFVYLAEAVPDAILEIRYYSTYNLVGDRIDGYERPTAMLTVEAARALKAVSDDLKAQGYRLKIFDAYRPAGAGSMSQSDMCTVCNSLICADCCCEMMGGDLIPCC